MGSRKASLENGGTGGSELLSCIPPSGEIHLATAGDGHAELEQPVEIQIIFVV
jgi:hypothetical protein